MFSKKDLTTKKGDSSIVSCGMKWESDERSCVFHLDDAREIHANIVMGDQGAYQFRFDDKNAAEKALAWIKQAITAKSPAVDLQKARVTEPKKPNQSYIFRLVGPEQWKAFQDIIHPENKLYPSLPRR